MRFHRKLLLTGFGLLICAAAAHATHLAPFIDLQEQGLSMTHDGKGLMEWGGGPVNLTVTVPGPVRFALLYWAGREKPCTLNASGTECPFSQPYKDQVLNFNGTPLTGTVIGSETQPLSGGGTGPAILNIGYYADVTGIVSAAGTGTHRLHPVGRRRLSNFWRFDGVGLLVAYQDATTSSTYRLLIWDGMDSPTATIPRSARRTPPIPSSSITA